MHIKFATTLHIKSGLICLAPPTSLNCTQAPFSASSCLPLLSILN